MCGHYGGNPFKWDGGTNNPHIARYFLARGWVMPGETVLDVGCGNGYGTFMLSQVAKHAIGIEVDEGCVQSANGDWKMDNNEFICADLDTFELPDTDVSVCIENAEHVCDFPRLVEQLQKHTRRAIVITVPIGGTTYAYVNEPPSPATEKTDFNNSAHVESIFATNGWKIHTAFEFGYSHFGVYYKEEPKDERE